MIDLIYIKVFPVFIRYRLAKPLKTLENPCYLRPTWPSLATLEGGSCIVPEAVVTVLCTPDDGCGWHPKHVEWTCRITNRLLCVASLWANINTRHGTLHTRNIDVLPHRRTYKKTLNSKFYNFIILISNLARTSSTPWWWSVRIETCRSEKCY